MIAKTFFLIGMFAIFGNNHLYAKDIPFFESEYEPAKWPVVHLRLSKAGTLKDVFDSGLRPYRFPGLESSTLEVKHIRLVLHLASGETLPEVDTEWMRIKMYADGEISQIEGATPQLSLQEARLDMLKWLPYGTRDENDLDNYLKIVEDDYLNFDDPFRGRSDGCGIGWKEPGWGKQGGGAHCGVGFRKTFNQAQPLRFYFSLSWSSNRALKNSKSYSIPIPPPPGYEDVSMEAPEKFGPDSAVDILRAQGYNIGDGKGGKPIPGSGVNSEIKPISERAPKTTTTVLDGTAVSELQTPNRLPWIIAGVLLLGILALLLIVFKCKRAKKGQ